VGNQEFGTCLPFTRPAEYSRCLAFLPRERDTAAFPVRNGRLPHGRDLKFARTSYKTIPAWRDSKRCVRVSWTQRPCARQEPRAYGNDLLTADGAGDGFASRGWTKFLQQETLVKEKNNQGRFSDADQSGISLAALRTAGDVDRKLDCPTGLSAHRQSVALKHFKPISG